MFLCFWALVAISSYVYAAPGANDDSAASQINPFSPNYLYFGAVKNTPLVQTAQTRQGGYLTYLFGYRHNLEGDWIMGLNISFKSFKRCADGEEISYFTFTHEVLHIIRLYHPFYLLAGLKFLYLYPTLTDSFPLSRNADLDSEVGAAAALALARHIDPKTLVTIEVNRWRGTKTNHLHGTEVAFGINRSLK